MKRIILLELCLLFLATTFQGDNPSPGWYIQAIPVNKNIVDIYFTDTLHGWAVTGNSTLADTGYILKTSNGGLNWIINYSNATMDFAAIQFVSEQTGYTASGQYSLKTTNSGTNWFYIYSGAFAFTDIFFINKDTGWVCDYQLTFGVGLLKTTNGGINWTQQLDNSYRPKKLFFLNKDTGWVMTDNSYLYRTTNSGVNWNLLNTFGNQLYDLCFSSIDTGWVIQFHTIFKTTNGGLTYVIQADPNPSGSSPYNIKMFNSKYGYISTAYSKIIKTFDGTNWKRQDGPSGYYNGGGLSFTDSLHGWVSHFYIADNNIASTIDGGGPVLGINNIITEVSKDFELGQNYPNPFNATSNIKYKISRQSVNVQLKVYDIKGKEIATLVNQKQSSGTYEYRFDGSNLSSGIYFYSLFVDGVKVDTKRMMLLK